MPPASSASRSTSRRRSTTPAAIATIAAGASRRGRGVRVRRADHRAAAVPLGDAERPSVAAPALARRRSDRAGDHERRRGHRRVDHARRRGIRRRAGVRAGDRADSARRHLRHAGGASRGAREPSCSCGRSTSRPPCVEQDEALVTYAAKITPAERELDSSRPAVELERLVRALTPHIGAYVVLGDGTRLGVSAARVAAGEGRPTGKPPPQGTVSFDASVPVLGTRRRGARAASRCSRRAAAAMSGEDYLRGRRR